MKQEAVVATYIMQEQYLDKLLLSLIVVIALLVSAIGLETIEITKRLMQRDIAIDVVCLTGTLLLVNILIVLSILLLTPFVISICK